MRRFVSASTSRSDQAADHVPQPARPSSRRGSRLSLSRVYDRRPVSIPVGDGPIRPSAPALVLDRSGVLSVADNVPGATGDPVDDVADVRVGYRHVVCPGLAFPLLTGVADAGDQERRAPVKGRSAKGVTERGWTRA